MVTLATSRVKRTRATVGRDVDALCDIGAVEVEPVQAVLALDHVAAVVRVPLEHIVARAEKSDIVARTAIEKIVAGGTIERVGAGKSEQDVCAVISGQNVALIAPNSFSMPLRMSPAAPPLPRPVGEIDADGERGRGGS